MTKVYTKDYCPYCTMAKNLLTNLGVDFQEIDITNDFETMQEISKKSKMMTVPQIFFGDKCLGGYTDIAKLHQEGKLLGILGGN